MSTKQRGKRSKTAISDACRTFEGAVRSATDLAECERLQRELRRLLEEADDQASNFGGRRVVGASGGDPARVPFEESLKRDRIQNGQCADCGLQTHEVRTVPLTNDHVTCGRCLLCHPAPSAAAPREREREAAKKLDDLLSFAPRTVSSAASSATSSVAARLGRRSLSRKGGSTSDAPTAATSVASSVASSEGLSRRTPSKNEEPASDAPRNVSPAASAATVASSSSDDVTMLEQGVLVEQRKFRDKRGAGDYFGELDEDGVRHGTGKISWEDGATYEGTWRDGKPDGRGLYRRANGDAYDGEWKEDKLHGRGTYRWASGNVYEGEWEEGKRHGWGVKTYANGNAYRGEWKANRASGRGTWRWKDGRTEVGRFVDGKPSGEGVGWGKDRRSAWISSEGKVVRDIGLEEAEQLALKMGFVGVSSENNGKSSNQWEFFATAGASKSSPATSRRSMMC